MRYRPVAVCALFLLCFAAFAQTDHRQYHRHY
jgi:hypothetical protein